jgi:hypothetical protein
LSTVHCRTICGQIASSLTLAMGQVCVETGNRARYSVAIAPYKSCLGSHSYRSIRILLIDPYFYFKNIEFYDLIIVVDVYISVIVYCKYLIFMLN